MNNLQLTRKKPGETLRRLKNGDRVGIKIIKERIVITQEVLFVAELGDYSGITLRMTLEEAKSLQTELAQIIAQAEAEFPKEEPVQITNLAVPEPNN